MCRQDSTLKLLVIPLYIILAMCNYLLRGFPVAVNMKLGALSWLNVETVERAPTSLFGRLVR